MKEFGFIFFVFVMIFSGCEKSPERYLQGKWEVVNSSTPQTFTFNVSERTLTVENNTFGKTVNHYRVINTTELYIDMNIDIKDSTVQAMLKFENDSKTNMSMIFYNKKEKRAMFELRKAEH